MSLDSSPAICEDIGRQLLTYGRRISPAEVFARIDAVDVDAINACARSVIDDQVRYLHSFSAVQACTLPVCGTGSGVG